MNATPAHFEETQMVDRLWNRIIVPHVNTWYGADDLENKIDDILRLLNGRSPQAATKLENIKNLN